MSNLYNTLTVNFSLCESILFYITLIIFTIINFVFPVGMLTLKGNYLYWFSMYGYKSSLFVRKELNHPEHETFFFFWTL